MNESPPPAGGRIFISYRREETAWQAGWLFDRLSDRFGRGQIFKDVDSIQLGDDFVEVINTAVGACDVLLALIGDQWLTVTDGQGNARLDNPDDYVRLEIEAALTRDVRVIPILVGRAGMPRAEEVPASLAKLVRRNALELSPSRFEFDTGRLLKVLERTLAEREAHEAARRQAEEQAQHEAQEARVSPASVSPGSARFWSAQRAATPVETNDRAGHIPRDRNHGGRKGRRWAVGGLIATALVAAAVVVAVVINHQAASTNEPPNSSGATSSTASAANARPVGPPLPNDVILWGATRNGVQQIWRIRSNGTDARLVGPGPNNNRQSISHDRRTIAYVHTSGTGTNAITSVRLVGTDGKHDHPLFAAPPAQCPAAGRPAFSPNDKTLALLCQPDWPRRNKWAIYLVDMTGRILGSPRAVGVLGDPTFNREGTEIGYWRAQNDRGPATRVEEVNATGSPHPRALTGWFVNVEDPMFSPIDDSLVMRIGNCAANGCDIYVLREGSAAPARLTHNGITEVDPAWSPDGTQIAYSRGPEANADVWVMNSDGTDQRPLIRDTQPDVTPTWASR